MPSIDASATKKRRKVAEGVYAYGDFYVLIGTVAVTSRVTRRQ